MVFYLPFDLTHAIMDTDDRKHVDHGDSQMEITITTSTSTTGTSVKGGAKNSRSRSSNPDTGATSNGGGGASSVKKNSAAPGSGSGSSSSGSTVHGKRKAQAQSQSESESNTPSVTTTGTEPPTTTTATPVKKVQKNRYVHSIGSNSKSTSSAPSEADSADAVAATSTPTPTSTITTKTNSMDKVQNSTATKPQSDVNGNGSNNNNNLRMDKMITSEEGGSDGRNTNTAKTIEKEIVIVSNNGSTKKGYDKSDYYSNIGYSTLNGSSNGSGNSGSTAQGLFPLFSYDIAADSRATSNSNSASSSSPTTTNTMTTEGRRPVRTIGNYADSNSNSNPNHMIMRRDSNLLFVSCDHDNGGNAPQPVSIAIAKNIQMAYDLLDSQLLAKTLNPSRKRRYTFEEIKLDRQQAYILSICTIPDVNIGKKYSISKIPDELFRKYADGQENKYKNKVYLCENHFSEKPVRPVSIIVAPDETVAKILLDNALIEDHALPSGGHPYTLKEIKVDSKPYAKILYLGDW